MKFFPIICSNNTILQTILDSVLKTKLSLTLPKHCFKLYRLKKKCFLLFIWFWPFRLISFFCLKHYTFSVSLFVCLSVCLSICVSLSVSICLSVCLPLSLSLSLPVSLSPLSLPSIRKSLLSVSLYHYLFLSIYLPIRNSLLLIGRLIFCWTSTFINIDLRHQSDYSGSIMF